MIAFLEASLQPVNLPYTFLMVLVMLYWLSVIIGVLDFDFLDFDVDVDADLDVDADTGVHSSGGFMTDILQFIHLGVLPFMIVLSFLAFFMWMASVITNFAIGNESGWVALGLFFPIFLGSFLLTKLATLPLVKVFATLNKEADINVIGMECTLMESADSKHLAHGKVVTNSGLIQMINVRTIEEDQIIPKGSKAIVVEYDETRKCYLIAEGVS